MQAKAGNTTWTAHTHTHTHVFTPALLPRILLVSGANTEQHSSVKVAVGENQRSHQSPHVQHDANPAGRDLHPH